MFRTAFQDQLDPFSLVAEELSLVANRLRSMVVAEVSRCVFFPCSLTEFLVFFCNIFGDIIELAVSTMNSYQIITVRFHISFHPGPKACLSC